MGDGNVSEIAKKALSEHFATPEFSALLETMVANQVTNSANSAVRQVVESRAFGEKSEEIYRKEIHDLIDRSESKARRWAGIAAVLFFLIFTGVLAWQLADAKQKLADLSMQQAAALDSINRFNNSVDQFKTGINKQIEETKTNVSSASVELTSKLSTIESTVRQLETRAQGAIRAPSR